MDNQNRLLNWIDEFFGIYSHPFIVFFLSFFLLSSDGVLYGRACGWNWFIWSSIPGTVREKTLYFLFASIMLLLSNNLVFGFGSSKSLLLERYRPFFSDLRKKSFIIFIKDRR